MCAHSFAHNARDSERAVRPNPRLHGASPKRTPRCSPLRSRSISGSSMPLCIAALRGLTALLSLCFPLQASLQTDFQAVTPPGLEDLPASVVRIHESIFLPFGMFQPLPPPFVRAKGCQGLLCYSRGSGGIHTPRARGQHQVTRCSSLPSPPSGQNGNLMIISTPNMRVSLHPRIVTEATRGLLYSECELSNPGADEGGCSEVHHRALLWAHTPLTPTR